MALRRRRLPKTPRMGARALTLALIFSVICLAYVIVLAVFCARGSDLVREEGYTRTYTVPGVRGEIYDKNGKLLVGNSTVYDLVYEYGAMPETRREVNEALLATLSALEQTGNRDKLAEDLFILEGTYPDMTFCAALSDPESRESHAFSQFLTDQKMDPQTVSEDEVVSYFTKRYSLSEERYTPEEITGLIRLYYEMERADFGAYASYTIAEDVSMDMITAMEETNIEGVVFVLQTERVYVYPGIASHILGRVGSITAENKDQYLALGYSLDAKVGTSGVEQAFEEWLHGQDGTRVIRYDDDGKMIESYYDPAPVSGKDVYLTIDIDLQIAAEEGLAENIGDIDGADAGAITVMDPNSGSVLAVASYPTYDLSRFDSVSYVQSLNENPDNPWLNRALQGVYAPGSTYKIGMALAGLESGQINANTTYVCDHIYPLHHNPTCLGTHGKTDVVDAIRDSCNIFFYYLGEAMGIETATDYTTRLGLGVKTGIELSERIGLVAGPAYRADNNLTDWGVGDDLSAAIGQSDHGYTPLQLSVYMSSVVNGGTRYEAHLLDSVRTFYTGQIVEQYQTTVADRVTISDETYELLIEGMGKVVSESTTLSHTFRNLPVAVGGKTGTAQVSGKKDYAVFSCFAPLKEPEIVISCVIEEGLSGGRAAPAAAKVMEVYFAKQAAESAAP